MVNVARSCGFYTPQSLLHLNAEPPRAGVIRRMPGAVGGRDDSGSLFGAARPGARSPPVARETSARGVSDALSCWAWHQLTACARAVTARLVLLTLAATAPWRAAPVCARAPGVCPAARWPTRRGEQRYSIGMRPYAREHRVRRSGDRRALRPRARSTDGASAQRRPPFSPRGNAP